MCNLDCHLHEEEEEEEEGDEEEEGEEEKDEKEMEEEEMRDLDLHFELVEVEGAAVIGVALQHVLQQLLLLRAGSHKYFPMLHVCIINRFIYFFRFKCIQNILPLQKGQGDGS